MKLATDKLLYKKYTSEIVPLEMALLVPPSGARGWIF